MRDEAKTVENITNLKTLIERFTALPKDGTNGLTDLGVGQGGLAWQYWIKENGLASA